jgi:NAD(P)-dependent dehydrogenase (short-subunit alcohol dehydrogenase family)
MSRVLITGSSTGLGFMVGQLLVEQGHKVILHARNQTRADDTCMALPQASASSLSKRTGSASLTP